MINNTVRKAHVKRIIGKTGDISQSPSEWTDVVGVWADVLRIDMYNSYANPDSQGVVVLLKWQDDPSRTDVDPAVGNPARILLTKKIINPLDPHPEAPSVWIPIDAVVLVNSRAADQGIVGTYRNKDNVDQQSTSDIVERNVVMRRVYHYNVDTSSLSPNDGSKLYMDYGDYLALVDGTSQDKSQYVDEEILRSFGSAQQQGFDYTGSVDLLRNNYVGNGSNVIQFDQSPGDVSADTIPPIVRLDPYQLVLNIQWLAGIFVMFETRNTGIYGNQPPAFGGPPDTAVPRTSTNFIHVSRDGKNWTEISVPGTTYLQFATYGNGTFYIGYDQSSWLYSAFGDLISQRSGQNTIIYSVDGFDWTHEVTSVPSFLFYDDGFPVITYSPALRNFTYNVDLPIDHKNTFQYSLLTDPGDHNFTPLPEVLVTQYVPGALPTNSVPASATFPYPGKITDVLFFMGGLPGFWYSEDHGVTYTQSLSIDPTSGWFGTFNAPGKQHVPS